MKILFLYTELADYTIACLKALKKVDPGVQLFVIHFPINPEAPFRFDFGGIGRFECVKDYPDYPTFKKDLTAFAADKIICSGWVNKWYLRYCFQQRNQSQCILLMDNAWTGNLKQQMLRIISRLTLNKIFKKIWVPGPPQQLFAKKIGFREKQILTGYYSCDTERFNNFFEKSRDSKRQGFPHRFLCVARYIPEKGYDFLWKAFIQWKERSKNDWELWCAGTGAQFESRTLHPAIRHLGFVQKEEWESVVAETGVFVLASHYEPWGVVVHEFAASGYPLLVSNKVGAATLFLSEKNGFSFDPIDVEDLIAQLDKISRLPDEVLYAMGSESQRLSAQITPVRWANTLIGA